ncbi:MAG: IS110 family transposase [Spirulinaceae cyanobacterium SM2_1_0]|nr:IS110 family transposase [Spirulinaceae cyanobacterium SM2_1_0]
MASAKTDVVDARVIARFGSLLQPPVTVFDSESAQPFPDWVRRRPQLVEMLSGEKNRRQQRFHDPVSRPVGVGALNSKPMMYQHLLDQGNEQKVALIACAKKLLTYLKAMLKSRTPWPDELVTARDTPA